jgi:hypothetical protein
MGFGKKVFTVKSYGAALYKWSPEPNNKKDKKAPSRPYFCTAVAGSNGQDWISTYAYITQLNNGVLEKIPYVECDYVA